VRTHIKAIPRVVDVHDLHAWTITSGVPVLSAHVVVDQECIYHGLTGEVLDALAECLGEHFDTDHCTFQLEPISHMKHEAGHHIGLRDDRQPSLRTLRRQPPTLSAGPRSTAPASLPPCSSATAAGLPAVAGRAPSRTSRCGRCPPDAKSALPDAQCLPRVPQARSRAAG